MRARGIFSSKLALILLLVGLCSTGQLCTATEMIETHALSRAAALEASANINVAVGQTASVNIEQLDRFLVGAPNLVSVKKSDDEKKLLITGKKAGRTVINIWDTGELQKYIIQVSEGAANEFVEANQKPTEPRSLKLKPGDSQIVNGKNIRRTATSEPGTIDIVPVSTTELMLNAKAAGSSVVRIWDDNGLTTFNVDVEAPTPPKVDIAEQIVKDIGIPTIKAKVSGEGSDCTITLLGECPNMDLTRMAVSTASAYGKVQNLILVQSAAPTRVVDSLKEAINNPALTYRVLPDESVLIEGSVPTHEEALRIKWIIQTWLGTSPEDEKGVSVSTTTIIGDNGEEIIAPDVKSKARLRVGTDENRGVPEVSASDDRNVTRYVWGGRIPDGPRIVAAIAVNPALSRQILVSAQIIEIDRTKLKDLGVEWGEINARVDADGNIVFNFVPQPFVIGEDVSGSTIRPIDEIGPFRRLRSLGAQINALITESKARILSEPKVLIADGGVANIHLGGQIPVPVAQDSQAGAGSITIDWKDFGILLTVRPQITEDRRVYMTVTPEASSLDFANAVEINGFTLPAIRQRRATTVVHVNNGESLVIGGLISSEDARTVRRIPLLSKIPIIGELFQSKQFTRNESELIILVTPQIIERGAASATAANQQEQQQPLQQCVPAPKP